MFADIISDPVLSRYIEAEGLFVKARKFIGKFNRDDEASEGEPTKGPSLMMRVWKYLRSLKFYKTRS